MTAFFPRVTIAGRRAPLFAIASAVAACSSSSSSGISFDSGTTTSPHHDASTKDGGGGMTTSHDAAVPLDAPTSTHCTKNDECASQVCGTSTGAACAAGLTCSCQPATCTDGVQNGLETDVDCGGGACPKCKDASTCLLGHQDCVSGECGVGTQGAACTPGDGGSCTCQTPTCDDGVKNGAESDVDCGGGGTCPTGETCPVCSPCTTGKICVQPTDCISATCTSSVCGCPMGMTEASTSLNVPYCIDAYEATYTEYTAFKNANNVMEQPDFCSWNTTYAPANNYPQEMVWSTLPVTNVNWCDAYMFCHTAGKHLCGQIADKTAKINEGDAIDPGDVNVATKDEWYNACSDQGANVYPYAGQTYQPNLCNGADSVVQAEYQAGCNSFAEGSPSPRPTVGANETMAPPVAGGCGLPNYAEDTCIGGTSNVLFDMSGNVAEWENACAPVAKGASASDEMHDYCAIRGGSYLSSQGDLTCSASHTQVLERNATPDDVGIRCCL